MFAFIHIVDVRTRSIHTIIPLPFCLFVFSCTAFILPNPYLLHDFSCIKRFFTQKEFYFVSDLLQLIIVFVLADHQRQRGYCLQVPRRVRVLLGQGLLAKTQTLPLRGRFLEGKVRRGQFGAGGQETETFEASDWAPEATHQEGPRVPARVAGLL